MAARGRLTERVHLVTRDSRRAPQILVIGVLDAFLADHFARFEALVRAFFEFFFGDLAGMADDVGGLAFVGVVAEEHLFHGHAREFPLVFFDVVDDGVADVFAQRQRRARRDHGFFFFKPFQHLRQLHVDELAQSLQLSLFRPFLFGQPAGVDLER